MPCVRVFFSIAYILVYYVLGWGWGVGWGNNVRVHTTASVASVSLMQNYVHDIPNMYIKAAAQVLSVLSVVQKGPICTAMY